MKNVVIVVDMLKGFHNIGNLANPRMAKIIPKVKKLLEKKTREGWKVIFLCDSHESNDKEFEIFLPHCIEGTEEAEIIDELQGFTKKAIIIKKKRYSGFYKTNLEGVLERINPKKVIVIGVCSDICVLHTVAGLRNRDYRVIVIKDCVETYDAPNHPAGKTTKWALAHMFHILGAETERLQLVI